MRADPVVRLAWDPSAGEDVAGYVVVYGFESGRYTFTNEVGQATKATIRLHVPGKTYYFAALAYNKDRVYSPPSNEVKFQPRSSEIATRIIHVTPETAEVTLGNPVRVIGKSSGAQNRAESEPAVELLPRLEVSPSDSGGLELTWPCAPGLRYQVMHLPDIHSADWTPASDTLEATGTRMQWRTRIGPDSSAAFFRLQIAAPQP